MSDKFAWIPSREQEFLLKAALLDGNECITAWEEWKLMADIEGLDGGSQRLLPLALYNLKDYKNAEKYFKKGKSIL